MVSLRFAGFRKGEKETQERERRNRETGKRKKERGDQDEGK